MRRVAAIPWVVVLSFFVLPNRARAGDIEIVAADGTPWPRLVEQIQDDPESAGRRYQLVVREGGVEVRCGDYKLALDEVARAAFKEMGCDATSATSLRLVNRAALFAEGRFVPRALRATITATISHHVTSDGGGAADKGGSKLWCSVALQPYLSDRLHGENVPLTPDRFVLRPIESHIQAAPDGSGWIAKGESRFSLLFHYQVTDIHNGEVVLENEASLVCADGPAHRSQSVPTYEPVPAVETDPAIQAPRWVVSIDVPFVPFVLSAVGSVLVRPLGDLPSAKPVYGSQTLGIWGGTTLGFSYLRGPIFVPVRTTLAANANTGVFAWSNLAGVGPALNPTAKTTLYSAAAVRYTFLGLGNGVNEFDGAVLLGVRHRIGYSKGSRCPHGWDLLLEAAAPVGSVGPWLLSAGIAESLGPGGHIMFASSKSCR